MYNVEYGEDRLRLIEITGDLESGTLSTHLPVLHVFSNQRRCVHLNMKRRRSPHKSTEERCTMPGGKTVWRKVEVLIAQQHAACLSIVVHGYSHKARWQASDEDHSLGLSFVQQGFEPSDAEVLVNILQNSRHP